MISVRILGPVQAWQGEQRLALGGPRQLVLFAFMVLHANRAVSRDALIDAVWGPERPDADNRLQMAVARLRKSLEPLRRDGESRLQTVSGGYLLSVGAGELDADRFHAGVHAGTRALEEGAPAQAAALLQEALVLWRGPPLAEVAFEDFAQAEIRRLEELRIRALECRIDAELELGRHAELVAELEGLMLEAPTREHVAAQLMLALYRSGRQADALEVYQRVRAALAAELGLEPGPALKALQIEILEQAASLASPAGSLGSRVAADARREPEAQQEVPQVPVPDRLDPYGPTVFAGRHSEQQALAAALTDAATNGRRAAFVTGEPGIGKTRLVSEFAQHAHATGANVLAGRCDDELGLPYQPFVEALEHLVEHTPAALLERHVAQYGDSIARLVPALAAHAPPGTPTSDETSESERYVLFRAIEGLLSAASQGRPLVLVLEDLHWADVPTLKLLRRLLTSPRSFSLMLVSTCRVDGLATDHPLRALLADLHREPHVLRLALTGLQDAEVAELLLGVGDQPLGPSDPALARTLETGTNGNPFFITELVRSLAESGALVTEHGRLSLTEGVDLTAQLPVSISETLARRLDRLSDDVGHCLGIAAVAGVEFGLELVSEVAGAQAAHGWIRSAVQSGIVIELPGQPDRFRFVHALMQRYLSRQLGPARQAELHRQIALAIERRGARGVSQLAELAEHWLNAAGVEVDTAIRYAMLAGDDALGKLAPDQARRWYDESLELLARGLEAREAQRCELLIRRGEAERQAGDRRFRETLLEAAEIARRTGDQARLVRAALANTRGMQSDTGIIDRGRIETLDAALAIVGGAGSPERARLLAMQAAELAYSREWERRVQMSDEALTLARGLNDPEALSTVLNMRFVTLLAPETLDERRDNTAEAVAVAERLSDPLIRFYAYHWRAYACIEAGDIVGARSWVAREQDIADRFRQPTTLWLRRADEANLAIVAGKLELADELATAALELGRNSEPDSLVCFAAQQTSIAFERQTLAELVPMLERAARDNPGVPGFRATLALALAAASRRDEASRLVAQAMASEFRELPHDVAWLAVACIYAHVSASLEDRAAAAVLYRMLEPWAEQIAFPAFGVWGPVAMYLGSLALVLGDIPAAERHLIEAGRAAVRAGAPIWEARAAALLEQLVQPA